MSDLNATVIEEFRANEGRVGGNFEGAPLLILHSRGARSGEPHVHPMMYLRDGEFYAEQAQLYPTFADYARKTSRVIPIMALTPAA